MVIRDVFLEEKTLQPNLEGVQECIRRGKSILEEKE